MKGQLIVATAFVLLGFLGGCATSPPPKGEIIPVPQERVFAFQNALKEKSGTIVVTRDKVSTGSLCFTALWIDSILAVRLDSSERVRFIVPIGEHVLRAGKDPEGRGLCAFVMDASSQRETVIRENETKYFRFITPDTGVPDIQRAD